MRGLKITTFSSAGLLVVFTALLMLLPREKYLVLSNFLGVLFWILLTATIFLVYLLIINIRASQRRMVKRNPRGQAPLTSSDKHIKGVNRKKDNNNNRRVLNEKN